MDLGIAGAAALVVGGTKGMGRSAAICLAQEGARVAVVGRDPDLVAMTADALRAAGSPDAVGLAADVGSDEDIRNAFDMLATRWGPLNILINTVGPDASIGGVEDLDDAAWAQAFDLGTVSAVRCVRGALPLLRRADWARIVNISAHSTRRQSPSLVAYTAAKAALTSVTKNLAQSLAPEGILVNTVSPGSFLSAGLRGYLQALPPERAVDPDDLVDAMRVIEEDFGHPAYIGRAGNPDEIGPVIVFLASRLNSYMVGANVNVDGGSDF